MIANLNFSVLTHHANPSSTVQDMALKTSTKGAAKTDDSQGDPTSQDASQDTGFSVGQMAKTFSDRAKEKVCRLRIAYSIRAVCNADPGLDIRKAPTEDSCHQDRS